jgi:hypothetical protein
MRKVGFEPSCAGLANSMLHGVCWIHMKFFFFSKPSQSIFGNINMNKYWRKICVVQISMQTAVSTVTAVAACFAPYMWHPLLTNHTCATMLHPSEHVYIETKLPFFSDIPITIKNFNIA